MNRLSKRHLRTYFMLLLLLFMLVLAACSKQPAAFKQITPQEAKNRLEKDDQIILLDVRTQEEHDEKHIPGSLLIPLDKLQAESSGRLPDKKTVIFVYCRSGNRSVTAAEILATLGYRNVYNLGGINDWPYETVTK